MGDLLVQLLQLALEPAPLSDIPGTVQQAISQQVLQALQTVLSGLSGSQARLSQCSGALLVASRSFLGSSPSSSQTTCSSTTEARRLTW
jgi:hypothetical protein